jgi:hypothetical protein
MGDILSGSQPRNLNPVAPMRSQKHLSVMVLDIRGLICALANLFLVSRLLPRLVTIRNSTSKKLV